MSILARDGLIGSELGFNTSKYKLGRLCKHGHNWQGTGKSLRDKASNCMTCKGTKSVNRPFPYTIFHLSGLHSFDSTRTPLEVYVRYGVNPSEGVAFASERLCKHGHCFGDANHSLRFAKKKQDCFVCNRISHLKCVDSGKYRENRAKIYAKNKDAHNQDCLDRYYRNREQICKRISDRWSQIKTKVDAGELPRTFEGNPCKKCTSTYRYTIGNSCIYCCISRANARRENYQLDLKINGQEFYRRLKEFEFSCAYCQASFGDKSNKLHFDHFIPLSKGGSNSIGNIIPACGNCNNRKYNSMPFQWFSSQSFFDQKRWALIQSLVTL